jgi:hypothetical protein
MNRMEKNMKKNLDFLFQLGQIGATNTIGGISAPTDCGFFCAQSTDMTTAICREERAEYNTRKGNKPRRLIAIVDPRLSHKAGLLNDEEAVMSAQRTAFVSVSSFCFYQKNTLRIFLHAALASGVMFCRVCLSAAVRYVNWIPACAGMTEVCHINVFAR